MQMMTTQLPTERWVKQTIQLPPGWHEAMEDVSSAHKLTLRDLYVAAAYFALSDRKRLKAEARRLRDMSSDDWEGFLALAHSDAPEVAARRAVEEPHTSDAIRRRRRQTK